MGDLRFISSSTVRAVNHGGSGARTELTPWDLQFLPYGHIQRGLLFPKPQVPFDTLIHRLKTSLSHTLHYFPPVAGRLATIEHEDDDTISFFIDCNNAGVLFVHAMADGVAISDIIKPVYVPTIVQSFFPMNGLVNYEGTKNPLLGIQVTDLADGIFVGCTINHVVADGSSFWYFLNSWSEISNGSINLSRPPVFQRSFLDGTDIPVRIPRSRVIVKQRNEEFECIPPLLRERIFHFSKQNIAKLKAKVNDEIGTTNISSLQALLSHFWRSVSRSKCFNPDEETKYTITIDVGARQRFPELPNNYFGNAVLEVNVSKKAKELLEQGTGDAARELNSKIATMTEESFKNFLESWPGSPRLLYMSNVRSNGGLVTSDSPRFDMYGNDFGWGKPIVLRSGSANKFDGKITLFCGSEEGSIDIEACLTPDTMEDLANDEEFMDIVTL